MHLNSKAFLKFTDERKQTGIVLVPSDNKVVEHRVVRRVFPLGSDFDSDGSDFSPDVGTDKALSGSRPNSSPTTTLFLLELFQDCHDVVSREVAAALEVGVGSLVGVGSEVEGASLQSSRRGEVIAQAVWRVKVQPVMVEPHITASTRLHQPCQVV